MSNREYLITILGKFGVTSDDILVILLESGIDPDVQIGTGTDFKPLKEAVYRQLPLMLAGIQDVSEGGYSVKWNLDGIKMWYSALAKELGLPDELTPKPRITGIKPW